LAGNLQVFTIDLSSHGGSGNADRALELLAAYVLMMAKFTIGLRGNLLLQLELPTEGFTCSHFADCLGALWHYADGFCHE
jgi:hypothetical protein